MPQLLTIKDKDKHLIERVVARDLNFLADIGLSNFCIQLSIEQIIKSEGNEDDSVEINVRSYLKSD